MFIPFYPMKVAQAAAALMRMEVLHRMSRLRLLKLLYIADRELLQERSRPLTGDCPIAMDNGPVLRGTYSLIKGADFHSTQWEKFFRNEGRDVHLINDPGVGKLSQQEIQKLHAISTRLSEWDDWAIAEYTHGFAEWIKNRPAKGSSNPISIDDLLEATGLADRKEQLLANERAETSMEQILA